MDDDDGDRDDDGDDGDDLFFNFNITKPPLTSHRITAEINEWDIIKKQWSPKSISVPPRPTLDGLFDLIFSVCVFPI